MAINEDFEQMESEYGSALLGEKNVFNARFFAELFRRNCSPRFVAAEKTFYFWNADSGLWKSEDENAIINRLSAFLNQCAAELEFPELKEKATIANARQIMTFLKALADSNGCFDKKDQHYIHCANGVLVLESGAWQLAEVNPEHFSRNRNELVYASDAQCPRFLNEFLSPILVPEDIELLRRYLGQCLLGTNRSQTFLLLTGPGGCGKSTLVNIIERIVGLQNCCQMRPEHIGGRFETSRFLGKTLLTGKEASSTFLCSKGAARLKELTGNDVINVELKGKNDVTSLRCAFNVIIVGNAVPQLKLDGDEGAWRRRIRWIKCRNFKPVHPDPDFAEKLLDQEGSGILNWILTGAAMLLSGDGKMPCGGLQARRIDYLIGSSNPLDWFIDSCVGANKGTNVTVSELYAAFTQFSEAMEWTPWPERRFQQEIGEAMMRKLHVAKRRDVKRNGKSQVGFCHVAFKQE